MIMTARTIVLLFGFGASVAFGACSNFLSSARPRSFAIKVVLASTYSSTVSFRVNHNRLNSGGWPRTEDLDGRISKNEQTPLFISGVA